MFVMVHILFCFVCIIGKLQAKRITTWSTALSGDSVHNLKENVTCPPDKPFKLSNRTHTECVASCGPGMVVDGSICINVTDCTKSVLSDGMCMDKCPEGYLYATSDGNDCGKEHYPCTHTAKDINKKPCVKRGFLILCAISNIVVTLLYIMFIVAFFSTKNFPVTKLMKCFKRVTHTSATLADEELLINNDTEED